MRFLMLSWRDPHNPRAGGAERVTLAYLTALAQRRHQVYWYANEFEGGLRQETIQGIQVVRGGGQGSSILKAIQWYRRQERFDLVIDQHHGIPWFAPWWCRTHCIAYLHEVLGPIWSAFYSWPLSTIGRRQERAAHWLYRKTPFWVGSESTERALRRRNVHQVKVIHYGIDLAPLAQLEPKPLLPPLRLIAVSRLAPNKRIDHAIQATAILLQKGIATQLSIVGTGEIETKLRRLVKETGLTEAVSFTGQLSEAQKDAELRRAHLLIHTSMREGWGLNVLEANAMGTPAVVYPVDGLVDSTLHNQTGMIAREETPESVVEAILELLKTPDNYQRFRVQACERTRAFQWSQILPPACDWLEQQAAKPRPGAG
jgi:glycosyltransferase involved in cell wall biosynthesis